MGGRTAISIGTTASAERSAAFQEKLQFTMYTIIIAVGCGIQIIVLAIQLNDIPTMISAADKAAVNSRFEHHSISQRCEALTSGRTQNQRSVCRIVNPQFIRRVQRIRSAEQNLFGVFYIFADILIDDLDLFIIRLSVQVQRCHNLIQLLLQLFFLCSCVVIYRCKTRQSNIVGLSVKIVLKTVSPLLKAPPHVVALIRYTGMLQHLCHKNFHELYIGIGLCAFYVEFDADIRLKLRHFFAHISGCIL